LVHRTPQASRRTAIDRDDGSTVCLEDLGCEAPAIVQWSFSRQENETQPVTPILAERETVRTGGVFF
jgi:hypothetical protein